MSFYELGMNRIKPYQVHNNSSKVMKLSLTSFLKQAMNCIGPTEFMNFHYCSSNSPYELNELNHEQHCFIKCSLIFMICHELFLMKMMNVHECSQTFINVHHLMSFISPGKCLLDQYRQRIHSKIFDGNIKSGTANKLGTCHMSSPKLK